MKDNLKVFISQPMNGKNDTEIIGERIIIRDKLASVLKTNYTVIDTFLRDEPSGGCVPLKYLAKSLELLADADVAFFAKGWEDARGCRIEHECAKSYGIMIIEDIDD